MPKDEFDFEDPFELNGVALVTEEDTTEPMCECFVEEFMRMGYSGKQILALFRNPYYLGMNMVWQNRGEEYVRGIIAELFARWGKQAFLPRAEVNELSVRRPHSDVMEGSRARLPDQTTRSCEDAANPTGAQASEEKLPGPVDPFGNPAPDING